MKGVFGNMDILIRLVLPWELLSVSLMQVIGTPDFLRYVSGRPKSHQGASTVRELSCSGRISVFFIDRALDGT